jgi:hypothetical protein
MGVAASIIISCSVVIAACSPAKAPSEGALNSQVRNSPAASALSIAQFVPSNAAGVIASNPRVFIPLLHLDLAIKEMNECWRSIEDKIGVAYQVFFRSPDRSFVVLEGELLRTGVEQCVLSTLLYNRLLEDEEGLVRDGELTVVKTVLGTVYAGWRGSFVVIGGKQDVTQALIAGEAREWREPLAEVPSEGRLGFSVVSFEPQFSVLLGGSSRRWKVAAEIAPMWWEPRDLVKEGEDSLSLFAKEEAKRVERRRQGLPYEPPAVASPEPTAPAAPVREVKFSGRVEILYATAAEAAAAGRTLAKGDFPIDFGAHFAAALAKLPQSIAGSTLVVRFDQTQLAGIKLADLQAWAARFQSLDAETR